MVLHASPSTWCQDCHGQGMHSIAPGASFASQPGRVVNFQALLELGDGHSEQSPSGHG